MKVGSRWDWRTAQHPRGSTLPGFHPEAPNQPPLAPKVGADIRAGLGHDPDRFLVAVRLNVSYMENAPVAVAGDGTVGSQRATVISRGKRPGSRQYGLPAAPSRGDGRYEQQAPGVSRNNERPTAEAGRFEAGLRMGSAILGIRSGVGDRMGRSRHAAGPTLEPAITHTSRVGCPRASHRPSRGALCVGLRRGLLSHGVGDAAGHASPFGRVLHLERRGLKHRARIRPQGEDADRRCSHRRKRNSHRTTGRAPDRGDQRTR